MYEAVKPPLHIFRDRFLSTQSLAMRPMANNSFLRLRPEQLPKAGDLIAIDAEFVSLRKEDAEIRRFGKGNFWNGSVHSRLVK